MKGVGVLALRGICLGTHSFSPFSRASSLTRSTREKPYLTSCFMLEPELNKTPDFTSHPSGSVVLEYSMEEGRMNDYLQAQQGGHKMVACNFNSGAICVLLNLFCPE